ncbi:MAG: hypothetical protein DDT21_01539 [Syntrophomonadaceae bacterium]|nr:hypothetical protein [Bacillota bacterium]MCL5982383.1 hypothetical protein [Bacillota bacterium]
MTNQLQLGQTVSNFGIIAKVVGFHEATGDPILQAHDIRCGAERWLADAAKCEPLAEAGTILGYKGGLVCFG